MSYDFRLFRSQPGIDPLVTAQADPDDEIDESDTVAPEPQIEERKHEIAEVLIKLNPTLEIFQFGFEEIAKIYGISIEEAQRQYQHLELNNPDDGSGIQITLYADEAFVTVPYWHENPKAELVFAEIWEYLRVIQTIGNYQIYDPQLEIIVDLASDLDKSTNCYLGVVAQI